MYYVTCYVIRDIRHVIRGMHHELRGMHATYNIISDKYSVACMPRKCLQEYLLDSRDSGGERECERPVSSTMAFVVFM